LFRIVRVRRCIPIFIERERNDIVFIFIVDCEAIMGRRKASDQTRIRPAGWIIAKRQR
jgi:hypothetical protein